MKIGIIGLGLMGGSFSYGIKELFPNSEIFGFDISNNNYKIASELGIIDSKLNINNISNFKDYFEGLTSYLVSKNIFKINVFYICL